MHKEQFILPMNVGEPSCVLRLMEGVLISRALANLMMLHSIIMVTCSLSISFLRYTHLFVFANQRANMKFLLARVSYNLKDLQSMEMIISMYQMIMLIKLWS